MRLLVLDLDETLITSKRRLEATRRGEKHNETALSKAQLDHAEDRFARLYHTQATSDTQGQTVCPLYQQLHSEFFACLTPQLADTGHISFDHPASQTIVIILTDSHYSAHSIRKALTEFFGSKAVFDALFIFNYFDFFIPTSCTESVFHGSSSKKYINPEKSKIGKIKCFFDFYKVSPCEVTIVDDCPSNILAAKTFGYHYIDSSAENYQLLLREYLTEKTDTSQTATGSTLPLLIPLNQQAILSQKPEVEDDGFTVSSWDDLPVEDD